MKNIRLQCVSEDDENPTFALSASLLKAVKWNKGDLIKIAIDGDEIKLSNVSINKATDDYLDMLEEDLYAIYGGD